MTTIKSVEVQVKEQRDALIDALLEVRDLIEGYVDVSDGDYGVPVANNAMRAVTVIDDAVAKVEGKS